MPDFQWMLESGSYLGIILFLIATGGGLPLPEEVAIIYAGVNSGLGELNPGLALGSCFIGAILGDWLMYGIGRLGYRWLRRHEWFAGFFHLEREQKMRKHIHAHAFKVFFAARFMLGVRGPLYISAGVIRFPFRRFILIDAVCATVVITLFFGISYFFGSTVIDWIRQGEYLLTAIAILVAVGVGIFFFLRHRREAKQMLDEDLQSAAATLADQNDASSMAVGS
jgi:membrane protein DedA with SNARE-associated domain